MARRSIGMAAAGSGSSSRQQQAAAAAGSSSSRQQQHGSIIPSAWQQHHFISMAAARQQQGSSNDAAWHQHCNYGSSIMIACCKTACCRLQHGSMQAAPLQAFSRPSGQHWHLQHGCRQSESRNGPVWRQSESAIRVQCGGNPSQQSESSIEVSNPSLQ